MAPGGEGPIASIRAISYDDMVRKGKEALESGRNRAASMYFGAALTVRPYSSEAREGMASARFEASRHKGREILTETEISLPAPPSLALESVDELIRKLEQEYGVGKEEEELPILGPDIKPAEEGDRGGVEKISGEKRPHGLAPRFPGGEKGERPTITRSTITTWIGVPTRMPCKPLRTGRNNLFHVLLHIPSFEAARTLPRKIWQFESGYDASTGNLNHGSYGWGLYIRYDNNRYDEGYLKISHGITEDIEPRIEMTVGNLREGDFDVYLSNYFTPYIKHYDRRADLGNLILGLKTRLYRPILSEPETGITSETSVKIPIARNPKNFTTSGMFDAAIQLMGTIDLHRFLRWPRLVPSASVGITLPFGEIFFDEDVDLDPVFFFGLGTTIQMSDSLALVAQIQGNTSAFGEFDPLSGMVLTSHVGARVLLGHFVIEGSFGHGFTKTSSDYILTLNIGFRFEGKDLIEEILR